MLVGGESGGAEGKTGGVDSTGGIELVLRRGERRGDDSVTVGPWGGDERAGSWAWPFGDGGRYVPEEVILGGLDMGPAGGVSEDAELEPPFVATTIGRVYLTTGLSSSSPRTVVPAVGRPVSSDPSESVLSGNGISATLAGLCGGEELATLDSPPLTLGVK